MNEPWKGRSRRLSIQYLRHTGRETGPGYFSFSWKWTISIPPIPDVGWRPPTDREKWKGTPFKLLIIVGNQFKSWLLIGTRSNGTKDAIILSSFPFSPFPLRSYSDCFQTNWRESFRIIILARVNRVIWSEKLSDKRSGTASKRVAYYRYVSLNVCDKKRDNAKVVVAKDHLSGHLFFRFFPT